MAETNAVFSAKLLAAEDNLASHNTALAKVELAALAREKSLLVHDNKYCACSLLVLVT